MNADLFGSYSMDATVAGISSLSRLKSIILYFCLWPPPRCRQVTWPLLLRPPVFFFGRSSDFSGCTVARKPLSLVSCSFAERTSRLVPGVIGRKCFNIECFLLLDCIANCQRHNSFLNCAISSRTHTSTRSILLGF